MEVADSEDIAKAICLDKFDPATGQVSASLFKDEGCSVSRLSVCPLEDTWDLFRQKVEKPPLRTLQRVGLVNVGRFREIGNGYANNPTMLTVEAAPLDGYPSHAVIPQKISRGLSNEIVRNLSILEEKR